MKPVLVIHGGTGHPGAQRRLASIRESLHAICAVAYRVLQADSALGAVVSAVQQLEDDPLFNAGTGSTLQRDGHVRMSASVMDGQARRFAGVLNIERVRYPVLVARALLARDDRVLAGAEATRFARSLGHPPWNPSTAERLRQWRARRVHGHGTVGAIALDCAGRLAAATSTGGKGFELPGRVSDSGLPVGNYADARVAVSCTGLGEDIVDEGVALRVAQQVADGRSLNRALHGICRELVERQRWLGAIGVDRDGRWVWDTTAPLLVAVAQTPARRVDSF